MSNNLLQRLRQLVPGDTMYFGEIVEVYSNGEVKVLLAEGGFMRVRGEGEIGKKVYFKGGDTGAIVGDAPDLPFIEIDV